MKINFKDFNIKDLAAESDFQVEVKKFITEWFSDSKTVEVLTSGSTGTPKALKIEKEKMRSSAQMTCRFFNFKEGNTALLCLPVAYISGKMMVVRAIETKMILKTVLPGTKPLSHLTESVDFCAMTPLQVEHSLDKIHLIKNLIIGGAQVSEHLKQKIAAALDHRNAECRIFETYGMSETLSHIALKEIYPTPQPYFTVLDSIKISQNELHCLRIEAPKLSAEVLQTNDVVELIDDRHFRFLGRTDFVINSGGLKIFPEKLEHFLKKELAAQGVEIELICTGIKDEVLGQKLVLFLEGEEDQQIIEMIRHLQFKNKAEKPKEIRFLKAFPRSENGKILRKKF